MKKRTFLDGLIIGGGGVLIFFQNFTLSVKFLGFFWCRPFQGEKDYVNLLMLIFK